VILNSDETILPKPDDLTSDQELILEKNIIWLFGTRRSGTTWLGKQLLSHNTHYLHEPNITDHLDLPMNQAAENLIRRIDARKDTENYFFSEKYKNTWSYYLGKMILNRVNAQFNDLSKKIIIKEPSSLLDASDILSSSTPKSKIIILVRDGRDVIDSLLNARQNLGWLVKKKENLLPNSQRPTFIKHRSRFWTHQMKILMNTFETKSDKNCVLIKYEDLLNNTKPILTKLYNFLNIEITDNEIDSLIKKFNFQSIPNENKGKGQFTRSASPGDWEKNFSNGEIDVMQAIMGETLKKLGYV